jgi:hypothetical protein
MLEFWPRFIQFMVTAGDDDDDDGDPDATVNHWTEVK